MKTTAIYVRVSSRSQDTRSQKADLDKWADGQENVKYYVDKASGKSMDRPAWNRLWTDLEAGKIDRVVVWRLDRLGRTASGLTRLFDDLVERCKRRRKTIDRDDTASTGERRVSDLAS